jgi:hypothetical protein
MIFLLIFVCPQLFVFPIGTLAVLILGEGSVNNLLILIVLYFALWYSWELAIGVSLSRFIHPSQKFRKGLYLTIFGLKIVIVVHLIISAMNLTELDLVSFLSVLPLLFCWTIFSWYIIYQNAKIIRSSELDKTVYFSDFYHYFFLQLILPLGICLIQSRINELIRNRESFKK